MKSLGEMVSYEGLLSSLSDRKNITTAPHERADLVNQFVEAINSTRGSYNPVTFAQVNGQLRKKDKQDLYIFLNQCKNARNFGAFFWYTLKQERQRKDVTSKVSSTPSPYQDKGDD